MFRVSFFFSFLTIRNILEGNMDIYEYLYFLVGKKKKRFKTWNYWAKAMLISKTLVHSPNCLVWWGRAHPLGHSFPEHFLTTCHVPATFCGLTWKC